MATRQLTTRQIVNLATDPVGGMPGQIYYNTSINAFKYYNGTSWTQITGGGGGGSSLTLLGDSFPEIADDGTLFFNYEYFILYIKLSGAWIQIGSSYTGLDGGDAMTILFDGATNTGGAAVEQDTYVDGGQAQPEQPALLA